MSTKHAALDRKLFQWIREKRSGITIPDAIHTLKILDKAERRHVNRRFTQLRSRGFLYLIERLPIMVFETLGTIPQDATRSDWINAQHNTLRCRAPATPRAHVSIMATNSHEFEAMGGQIERLPSFTDTPCRGGRPTGQGFTFDE